MKIRVEAGKVVMLDRKRSTSVKGGVYDVSDLPEEDQKRLLKLDGVSEEASKASAKKPAPTTTQKKDEVTDG